MSTLSEYIQEVTDSSIPILGHLFWITVPKVSVPHDAFRQALASVPDATVPPRPKDHDVFRRSSNLEYKRIPAGEGQTYWYFTREFSSSTQIVKRVVRELKNIKGTKLDYTECLDIVFYRPTKEGESGTVAIRPIVGVVPDLHSQAFADEVVKAYNDTVGHLDDQAIRAWITNYLTANHAVGVKRGLQFIPTRSHSCLNHISTIVEAVNAVNLDEVDFHSLPLIESGDQREMLRKAFEADTASALDEQMEAVSKALKKEKVQSRRFLSLMAEYDRLKERTESYKEVLNESLTTVDARVSILNKQLKSLAGKVTT